MQASFETAPLKAALRRSCGSYVDFDIAGDSAMLDPDFARTALRSLPVMDFPKFPVLDGAGVTRFGMKSGALASIAREG